MHVVLSLYMHMGSKSGTFVERVTDLREYVSIDSLTGTISIDSWLSPESASRAFHG